MAIQTSRPNRVKAYPGDVGRQADTEPKRRRSIPHAQELVRADGNDHTVGRRRNAGSSVLQLVRRRRPIRPWQHSSDTENMALFGNTPFLQPKTRMATQAAMYIGFVSSPGPFTEAQVGVRRPNVRRRRLGDSATRRTPVRPIPPCRGCRLHYVYPGPAFGTPLTAKAVYPNRIRTSREKKRIILGGAATAFADSLEPCL